MFSLIVIVITVALFFLERHLAKASGKKRKHPQAKKVVSSRRR